MFTKCPACDKTNMDERSHCEHCEAALDSETNSDEIQKPSAVSLKPEATTGSKIESRYTDAYLVASAVVAFGSAVNLED